MAGRHASWLSVHDAGAAIAGEGPACDYPDNRAPRGNVDLGIVPSRPMPAENPVMRPQTANSNVVVLARPEAADPADTGVGRRKAARRRVLKAAQATFCNQHCTISCTVRDISTTGARLRSLGSVSIPDTFELFIEIDGITAGCEVVWRRGNEIGVRFLGTLRKSQQRRRQVLEPPTNPFESTSIRTKPFTKTASDDDGVGAPKRARRLAG